MEYLRISLAQLKVSREPAENLKKAENFIKKAAIENTDIIVFPEMLMRIADSSFSAVDHTSTLDSGFPLQLADLAGQYKITVCAGVWEKSTDPQKAYNTAVVFTADGKLLTRYRKLHLFDALVVQESDLMLAGTEPPPLFSVAGFKIGLGICYDLRFPEHFRYLSAKGAELILLPAAWYSGNMKEEIWLTLLRARAIENLCFIAGADLTGSQFSGRSAAFDPVGMPLADAGREETLITFTASKKRLREIRGSLPTLKHRRDDVFL